MSREAVRAEGVSKSYWIPSANAPGWRDYLRRPREAFAAERRTEVLALDDVTFSVRQGEVLGIIGRNGAGKSTLLKVLSRITSPSAGRVAMAGRVASLLEVGTGFHPDLTGRENVYLNGMLLGMRPAQVDDAFDAICEFAGVGQYINVPIKRYSSGMQLRLAFAVAAHLAADTMIIDEVLAVGDAEFQRKCLGAMRDVSTKGRTTLFVSHNMSAVESLCSRVMWMDAGRIRSEGEPDHVIREYLAAGLADAGPSAAKVDLSASHRSAWTAGMARLRGIKFGRGADALARPSWHVAFGEAFTLDIEFALERPIPDLVTAMGFRNDRGEDVLTSHSSDIGGARLADGATAGSARVAIGQPWLRPGTYYVEAALLSGPLLLDYVGDAAVLVVEEQSASTAPSLGLKKGVVAPIWPWQYSATHDEAVAPVASRVPAAPRR
ncbi:MAG: ABC transporter ATP-binding protein [Gemmatimonadaceae bacterium]